MNFGIPSDFNLTVASNTTAAIGAFGKPAELIIGLLFAFLVIGMIISVLRGGSAVDALAESDYPDVD